MRLLVFLILVFYSSLSISGSSKNIELKSPDSKVQIDIGITDKITYSVNYGSETGLLPSAISMKLQDGIVLGSNPKLKNTKKQSVNKTIQPEIRQKRKEINDVYNELELTFQGNYSLVFRVYNDGIAYRFKTTFPDIIKVFRE